MLGGLFFVLVTMGCLTRCAEGWIFTDVNYTKLRVSMETDIVDDQTEIEVRFVYPGTKWCGAGNTADGYDDLGSSVEADKCCREHDHCPDVISGGDTKYNLTNDAFYSRLSCDCDEKFRKCLHMAHTKTASVIGVLYFNAIGTKCFRKDYPVKRCKRKGGFLDRKCLEYEYDYTGKKVYQWFDLPKY